MELVSDGSANAEKDLREKKYHASSCRMKCHLYKCCGRCMARMFFSTGVATTKLSILIDSSKQGGWPSRSGDQDDVRMTLRDCLPSLLKGKCLGTSSQDRGEFPPFFLLLGSKSSQNEDFSPGKEGVWKMIGHSWKSCLPNSFLGLCTVPVSAEFKRLFC